MKIAILGGGIAGIGCAIGLIQKGFEVTVYEKHLAASDIGAGIVVWPNAAFVLEQFGMLDDIAQVSGRPRIMRRMARDGASLGALSIETIDSRMGYASHAILRKDLLRVLQARLESLGGAVRYHHQIVRITTGAASEAEVHCSNGATIKADLIIGADGRMASLARHYVTGHNKPVYQGFINWIGVCERGEFDAGEVSDYWGTGERFGIVPVSRNKAYWAGGAVHAGIGTRNAGEYKDELDRIFSSWPKPVRDILRASDAGKINKIYVHDHDPVQTWHRHNLVLVGDAAHASLPTSGQGACQALEDAWHLVNCLADGAHDLPSALDKFTGLRFQKTANITIAGRRLAASLFNRDEEFCRERDERSRRNDFHGDAVAMANGWAHALPLRTERPAGFGTPR